MKIPNRDAEQAFGEIFMEQKALAITDAICAVIDESGEDELSVLLTAIEGVLGVLMDDVPDNERLVLLASLFHNTAIKLYVPASAPDEGVE